jgi:hypothetical protein
MSSSSSHKPAFSSDPNQNAPSQFLDFTLWLVALIMIVNIVVPLVALSINALTAFTLAYDVATGNTLRSAPPSDLLLCTMTAMMAMLVVAIRWDFRSKKRFTSWWGPSAIVVWAAWVLPPIIVGQFGRALEEIAPTLDMIVFSARYLTLLASPLLLFAGVVLWQDFAFERSRRSAG